MSKDYERFKEYYGMRGIVNELWNTAGKRQNHLFKYVISENNIRLAIKKISMNPGRNTAGPDNMTFSDIKKMDQRLVGQLIRQRLHLKILPKSRTVYIPKENGKFRKLGITNILDRISQQCILNILEPIVEKIFKPCSYGFRPNLSTKYAIASITQQISLATVEFKHPITIYKVDLNKCFDNISLDKCIESLVSEFNIHDSYFLRAIKGLMWIDSNKYKYKGKGLAQGSILGPVLANCLLHKIDKFFMKISDENPKRKDITINGQKRLKKFGYKNYRNHYGENCFQIKYIRYADDIVIAIRHKKDSGYIVKYIDTLTKEIGLEINKDKSRLYDIDSKNGESLDFLGYKIFSNEGIMLCPKDENKQYHIIKRKVKDSLNQILLSKKPNVFLTTSILASYIRYYEMCTDISSLIDKINQFIYHYGYKNRKIVSREKDSNVFTTIKKSQNGRQGIIDLYGLRKNTKNSYRYSMKPPYWVPGSKTEFFIEDYLGNFEETYKNIYIHGLLKKYPKDPVINIEFNSTNFQNIEIHHIVPLAKGGTDQFSNLIPVFKKVHLAIHASPQKLKEISFSGDIKKRLNKYRKLAGAKEI